MTDLKLSLLAICTNTEKENPLKSTQVFKNLTLMAGKEDQGKHAVPLDRYFLFILPIRTHRFCLSFLFNQHREV